MREACIYGMDERKDWVVWAVQKAEGCKKWVQEAAGRIHLVGNRVVCRRLAGFDHHTPVRNYIFPEEWESLGREVVHRESNSQSRCIR